MKSTFTPQQQKLLLLSGLGGILEFYDFIIFALFAGIIAKVFFPAVNTANSLMATFATFSIGYLARPIGGMVFGHFGDKLGRKKTFTFSVLIMAIATLGIGLVPSYHAIGITAPISILVLRIIQGLSVGGEIPGAIAYVSESILEKKGLACGIVFACLTMGIVLGSLVQAILSTMFSAEQMQSFGWRIPFIIGGVLGFLSYLFRRGMDESPLFKAIEHKVEKFPLQLVLKREFINAFSGFLMTGLGAGIITVLFLFLPAYLTKILRYTDKNLLWFTTGAILLASLLCIPFGAVTDKISGKKLLYGLIPLSVILPLIIFYFYNFHLNLGVWALALSALLTGFAWGIIPNFLSMLFPTTLRYSGIAFSYNIGFAIFGGLTPLIVTFLIYKTGSTFGAPAMYIGALAVLACVGLFFAQPKQLNK